MKIISKFKDYYDFYSNIYGIDEKVTYKRDLFNLSPLSSKPEPFTVKKREVDLERLYIRYRSSEKLTEYHTYWLIICGKRFLIYNKGPSEVWEAYVEDCDIEKYLPIKKKTDDKKTKNHWNYYSKLPVEYFSGEFSQKNLDLNVKVKSPIVLVECYSREDELGWNSSPILGDIKNLPNLYPADQLYQDINYFFLNQVNGSADIDLPVTLDDKYKISYHGFDKISFRPKMRT